MKLGYTPEQTSEIVSYIDKNGKIEGAPYLKEEHLPVFDCSLAPQGGGRSITWTGHVKMMAAAQPFLSGAISKTINMPAESTVEDIVNAYIESWRLGLKAVAIYRDNSKRSQPLNAGGAKEGKKAPTAAATEPVQRELFGRQQREKMPVERASVTHKFSVGGHEGYITVGMYEDNRPGEIFIKMSKEGSTLSGIMDGLALTISLGLQYGVPLKVFVDKLLNTRFDSRRDGGCPGCNAFSDEQSGAGCHASRIVCVQAEQRARGRANLQRVRHADGAERRLLQMRKLRQHERLQLRHKGEVRAKTR